MMDSFDETIRDGKVKLRDVQLWNEAQDGIFPLIEGRYLISKTSGTTGVPGTFINDRRSWAMQRGAVVARTLRNRLTLRRVSRFAWGQRYRMAFLVADSPFCVSPQSARTPMRLGKLFTDIRVISIQKRRDEIIADLNSFKPHYLHAYPTFMQMIAQTRIVGGPVDFDPEVVSFGSEPFTEQARGFLESAFPDSVLRNQYGTTECLPLGNQCTQGRMHLNSDYCIVEPMDQDGLPCPNGEFSDHLLITNLVNRMQPIIRYRIDDAICLAAEPCPCGSPFPVFQITGRADASFFVIDEYGRSTMLPSLSMTLHMLKVEGLLQYQAVHELQNRIRIDFLPAPGRDGQFVRQQIEHWFGQLLEFHDSLQTVRLTLRQVQDFDRTESGKLCPFVSLVDRPPHAEKRIAG